MKRKDDSDDILDAFSGNVPREELSPEEIDAVYSDALAERLVTEDEVRSAFARFLHREVVRDPVSDEATLAPPLAPSVGAWIRAYREQRNLTRDHLAQQFQLTVDQLVSIEDCTEPYVSDRLPDVSRSVATNAGVSAVRVHTLLQSIKATHELKGSSGPTLLAARKAPPK